MVTAEVNKARSPIKTQERATFGRLSDRLTYNYRRAQRLYSRVALRSKTTPQRELEDQVQELAGYLRGLKRAIDLMQEEQLDNRLPGVT